MTKKISVFLLLFSVSTSVAFCQSYGFKQIVANDNFEIQPTMHNALYCLFRASAKKDPKTIFRKVFLNDELKASDSVDYFIDGKARLLTSYEDEHFMVHTFYITASPIEKIVFIVTDSHGKMINTFSKTAVEISRYFLKPIKKLKNIQLSFLPNAGSPGMLLVRFQIPNSSFTQSKLFSLKAEDGSEFWISTAPHFNHVQTTEHLLIGLTKENQLFWFDKKNGQSIKSVYIGSKQGGYRAISVFATNGTELMLAGSDFESTNSKNGKFFMTLFNLEGEKIFEKVDTAQHLSTKRMQLMGSVFDKDGNVVLMAEGWKSDITRAAVSTGTSILLAVVTRGAVYSPISTSADHKIDQLIFATLSPADGSLQAYRSFPVDPWYNNYGQLITGGSHMLLNVNGKVFMYDVNDPLKIPYLYTRLGVNESLVLSSWGPIVVRLQRSRYSLHRLN